MRLELPTLLPAPGGITLGAGSGCGLAGAERCGVVAALGVTGGGCCWLTPSSELGPFVPSHEHCSGCRTWHFSLAGLRGAAPGPFFPRSKV